MVALMDNKHTPQPPSYWSFEALYEEYQGPIHSYIYHLVGNREQTDDLTQETFLKVFRALPKLDASAKIGAWIYRIARNSCYDALRRRKLVDWLPWQDLEYELADLESIDPQETYGDADLIRSTLRHMPERYRVALLLYTQEGLSYKEIAQTLNTTESGIKMFLSRARASFRKEYQELAQEHLPVSKIESEASYAITTNGRH